MYPPGFFSSFLTYSAKLSFWSSSSIPFFPLVLTVTGSITESSLMSSTLASYTYFLNEAPSGKSPGTRILVELPLLSTANRIFSVGGFQGESQHFFRISPGFYYCHSRPEVSSEYAVCEIYRPHVPSCGFESPEPPVVEMVVDRERIDCSSHIDIAEAPEFNAAITYSAMNIP